MATQDNGCAGGKQRVIASLALRKPWRLLFRPGRSLDAAPCDTADDTASAAM